MSSGAGRGAGAGAGPADWLLLGARIWTGSGAEAGSARSSDTGAIGHGSGPAPSPAPEPDALAIRRGRIVAVGRSHDVEALRGPDTAVLNLEGRCIVPGFVDAHVHLQAGGLQLFRVDLRGAASPEAFIRRVADRVRTTPDEGWILGGDWDHHLWGGELPSREWLDRAAPGRAVFLHRTDLHMGVASSRALELAGIRADTPDPENGQVDRDPTDGRPTGVLREAAMEAVARVVPPPTNDERRAAIRAAAIHALARGVTQLHDKGALQRADESWRSLATLRALEAEGRLPVRVSASVPISERGELARMVAAEGRGTERLRWGSVKAFVDGSLGSTTAWFHDPYRGKGEERGAPATDPGELAEHLAEAAALGLQPIVHAIGDRATDWILEVFAGIEAAHRDREIRPRLEHAQHMTPAGIRAAGRGSVICSVQPLHLVDDGRWAGPLLGPEREALSYPFRSLQAAGARLAFGSDWTVAPIDPLGNILAAVTRRIWEPGSGSWGPAWTPAECISLDSALRAHTLGAARAAFLDGDTGSLEVGKLADLAILSADPFALPPDEWRDGVRVEMTFVDGALVYRAEDPWMGGTET